MTSYNISFKPSVEKDLRPLPKQVVERVWKQIQRLGNNPYPHQAVKLSNSERLYRIRVGDYRIVYEVDAKTLQVMIHYIRHRRDVYRLI